MEHITNIATYILDSFAHTWPYLLLTIPVSVAVKMSGAAKYINRSLSARPLVAIFLSTFVGAFSPLCSCTVIPVIASLLIGGVPLAPVMSFWLASPSMDPEIFFLTVSSLGWDLAIWRLTATLLMSLGGGLITLIFSRRGWLGAHPIRKSGQMKTDVMTFSLKKSIDKLPKINIRNVFALSQKNESIAITGDSNQPKEVTTDSIENGIRCGCSDEAREEPCCSSEGEDASRLERGNYWRELLSEVKDSTLMVTKFMFLAWTMGAIIRFYVPEIWITNTLGGDHPMTILFASILGIPAYTSSIAALPMVGELLKQGMNPAAALAFLIAGPTTTLPAMSAVWGLVNRKVFYMYLGLTLFSAISIAYLYNITL